MSEFVFEHMKICYMLPSGANAERGNRRSEQKRANVGMPRRGSRGFPLQGMTKWASFCEREH